jgi:CheY-like chemotaxis protein
MLLELLRRKGHEARAASSGAEALSILPSFTPDMIISDIIMPKMDGFALMQRIEKEYPKVKRILMTGYEIDGYIEMIRRFNVGNIIPKGSQFNLDDIGEYVQSLLTGKIFGLDKYFPIDKIQTRRVLNHNHAQSICGQIAELYPPARDRFFFEIALNELVSNAVFHGVLQLTSIPREQWPSEFSLTPDGAVKISWACDNERIGVSVEDPRGHLRKIDVLQWLDHKIEEQSNENEHGRGFMLIRKFIDRFIVNIDRGKRTECVIVQNLDRTWKNQHKPLLVHEI